MLASDISSLPATEFFAMLAIVFIAPIVEEIIMRGWLYGKLRDKF